MSLTYPNLLLSDLQGNRSLLHRHSRGDGAAHRQKLSRVYRTSLNVLIFDTCRLFRPPPRPYLAPSLFLSLSFINGSLPFSPGSPGQTESRCLTTWPQPNLTPQHKTPNLSSPLVTSISLCGRHCAPVYCLYWISSDSMEVLINQILDSTQCNPICLSTIVWYWIYQKFGS